MNLLFEDMIRVETPMYVCRIWRAVDGNHATSNDGLRCLAYSHLLYYTNLTEVVTVLAAIESVNSVEVIDRRTGCGICVHKDWP